MSDTVRSRIEVHAFPSEDRGFRAFVLDLLDRLVDPTPEELQLATRERYPLARVSVRTAFATREGDGIVWYAFRRAIGEPAVEGWWERLETWALIADDRTFVEATEAFAAIVEAPLGAIIGRRLDDFTNPLDPTASDDIAELWPELLRLGRADGTLRFNRMDGSRREIEYHVEADGANTGRYRAVIRER